MDYLVVIASVTVRAFSAIPRLPNVAEEMTHNQKLSI